MPAKRCAGCGRFYAERCSCGRTEIDQVAARLLSYQEEPVYTRFGITPERFGPSVDWWRAAIWIIILAISVFFWWALCTALARMLGIA